MPEISNNKNLTILAPAKVNLHLEVLGLRSDGFHELSMIMQSINLNDKLFFNYRNDGVINLQVNNKNLTNGDDNLIIKAAKLLQKKADNINLGVDICLYKNIPIGAGLAGGSSDAAATLYGLNLLWKLGYTIQKLEFISSSIGSDIPFCFEGGTQLCFGRGEILEKVSISNDSLAIILVKDPTSSVSTQWAYSKSKEINSSNYLTTQEGYEKQRNKLRSSQWFDKKYSTSILSLNNDLQKIVAPVTPSVQKALKILASIPGNLGVAMSGSGPSCFALFSDLSSAEKALEQNYLTLKSEGFDSWSCSFLSHGVKMVNE